MTKNTNQTDQVAINIITSGSKIKGNLTAAGNMRIDGEIDGGLDVSGKLVVGENAVVLGNIKVQNIEVEGRIVGDIIVEDTIQLRSNANIQGNIITQKIVIEAGAIFNGNCKMPE